MFVENIRMQGAIQLSIAKCTHQCMRTFPSLSLAACMKSLHKLKYCVRFWSGESEAIMHR